MDFKKIRVPKDNDTKEVDAVQLWEVRWTSRYSNNPPYTTTSRFYIGNYTPSPPSPPRESEEYAWLRKRVGEITALASKI